jgi:inorganic pyrophosphatase
MPHDTRTAHPWHGVSARSPEVGVYNAFIEIVPTDVVKYEVDKVTGLLRLDRPHQYSSLCPTLYGFVPQTHCGVQVAARCAERTGREGIEGDGDPLDICVLSERAITHGNVLVRARLIGGLRMIDGQQADDKIIAVLDKDVTYGAITDIAECPPGVITRLQHYFLSYKQEQDAPERRVVIAEVYDRAEAEEVVARSLADYAASYGDPDGAIEEVLAFWFADISRAWKKDPAFDDEIRTRFGTLHAELDRGEHPEWATTARGALATILVLDQFSRNQFRSSSRAFASDARALRVAKQAVDRGFDTQLSDEERVFLYMPFVHSEQTADQDRSVALFTALGRKGELKYAHRHADIVRRFGRFPHRNAMLNRASTPEEAAFLAEPGSSF